MARYKSPAKPPARWKRPGTETLWSLLLLVDDLDDEVDPAVVAWTDYECFLAEEWAVRSHLRASDNNHVRVPIEPEHVARLPRRKTYLGGPT